MNLRRVDLNLLVVLDALLDECHVTRAANRVALSQPATSNALERCRQLFGDRLLERAGGGMRPTPLGEALRPKIRALLSDAESLLVPADPDLSQLRRRVRLVMGDAPASILVADLHRALTADAPGVDLIVQPWRGAPAALEALGRGDSDIAISVFPSVERDFRRIELSHEGYVVVMRRGHPALDGFDLDGWLGWPHVIVSGEGEARGVLDELLEPLGRVRRVGMVLPSFSLAAVMVAGSDLIGLLPERSIPAELVQSLAILPPPIEVSGFPLHLAWHRRTDTDAAVQHIINLIRRLLARS